MAHIKVTRRGMSPVEWLELRFIRLKRIIYSDKEEIDTFTIRDARQTAEMEYEFYDGGEARPLKRGDIYFTPDGTAFIEADFDVPERFRVGDYCFTLQTAAEMTVKVNGKYVGGIDPNRDRINLSDYISDTHLHFEITGYNRSKPDDERNPEMLAVRGCRQIFEGGYIAAVNKNILSLVYDIELLRDVAVSGRFDEDCAAFILKELNNALNLIDFEDIRDEDVLAASDYIEKHIYSDKTYRGSGRVELVAHSHLDIAYYWRRIHSIQKNMRTVLIQLRLMDKYPDFRYTHTQAYTYEMLEKYYPEIFAELRERIAQGRFEPVGAMYVEPDCNIPCAESLIRQCLYGKKYFREKFGIDVDNCWLPDVFGNSWILPQILKKCGVDYFVSNKMSTWNDTNRFPHNNFIWRGIDGSEVYACVPPTHFISWNMPSQIAENYEAFQEKNSGSDTMQMFGYGDGGSGCTEEMIELMHRFSKLSAMPETKHTGGREFLHDNLNESKKLEVWDDELYLEMHRGTFTTKAKLKDYNRRSEFLLREAEIISCLKLREGETYPAERIRELYKKLMVNQFHDILPGSHITPVYRDAVKDFEEITLGASGFAGGEKYFNSLNFKRNSFSFIECDDGADTRHGKKGRFVFTSLPALSGGAIPAGGDDGSWFAFSDGKAETPLYTAVFSQDGSILSLFDKELSREWVSGEFNRLRIFYDMPGNYDAWDIPANYSEREIPLDVSSPLEFLYADGECAALGVTLGTKKSTWRRIIRFFKNSRGIEVENIADWHEDHKLAKVFFGCNVLSRKILCDTSAGFIERSTHRNTSREKAKFEFCIHKWCDMSETDGGIAIINENKYGAGAENNEISISLLRSPVRPDPSSDRGEHDFCYMIYPHAGSAEAKINETALEYNIPLTKADVKYSGEDFYPLILQAMKLSEDGKKIIYRLSEQNGSRGKIKLCKKMKIMNMLEEELYETDTIEYSPFEIITAGEEI